LLEIYQKEYTYDARTAGRQIKDVPSPVGSVNINAYIQGTGLPGYFAGWHV